MGKKLDLKDKKFGKLLAIKEIKQRSKNGAILWQFQCECGKKSSHEGSRVSRGQIVSCGCEPELRNRKFAGKANGVDRIDSNIGYITNNIVSCCKICNIAKNNLHYNDFISWINRLIKFRLEVK